MILEMDPENEDVKTYSLGLNPPPLEAPIPEEPAAPDAALAAASAEAPNDDEQDKKNMLAQAESYSEKGLFEQSIDVYLDMLKRWPEWPEIRTRLQQVYALMARAAEPVEKHPSPEQIKAELEHELKEQMRKEMEEQTRRLAEEQKRYSQERQFEAEMKRELEQMRLKQDLESKLMEQVQRTKEDELREKISKEFEERQMKLLQERERLDKEKLESINKIKDELEQTKLSYEQKIREQVEREMKDRFQSEAAEKERREKDAAREAQLQAALQKQEQERARFEEQKKVHETARAQVDQEISHGMERLRQEKEREKKNAPPAPIHPPAVSKPSGSVVPAAQLGSATGNDSLEDPFIRQTLADIYAKQGLFVEALKIYERILNEDPDNEDVKEKLRNILKMKGI